MEGAVMTTVPPAAIPVAAIYTWVLCRVAAIPMPNIDDPLTN